MFFAIWGLCWYNYLPDWKVCEKLGKNGLWKDACFGPKTAKQAHLFYDWQRRPENPMDRYGHFSFLTPALLEPADLVLPTTAPTLAGDGFLKFLDQDLGDVSWVSTGCWKMVFVIKAYLI